MLTFVVVEDNHLQIRNIKEIINKFMMKNENNYRIKEFYDSTEELDNLIADGDNNKIYILDFELPSSTAIDIARKIRKLDWKSIIIVISAHGSLAYDTFKQRLQILDFVCKQFEPEKNLIELFNISINRFDTFKPVIIKKRSYELRIYPQNILYIYKNGNRKSVIVTQNDTFEIVSPLSAIANLFGNALLQVHKSCYINMKRVTSINWSKKQIVFDNSATCDLLSEHYKKEVDCYE